MWIRKGRNDWMKWLNQWFLNAYVESLTKPKVFIEQVSDNHYQFFYFFLGLLSTLNCYKLDVVVPTSKF